MLQPQRSKVLKKIKLLWTIGIVTILLVCSIYAGARLLWTSIGLVTIL